MDYNEAYKQFSTTYTAMSKRLEEWVNYQGGKIDAEGMVQGLTDKLLIRYNTLNDDLASMLEFVQAVEGDRKEKLAEIERLKIRCRMLETAAKAEKYTDAYVMQEVNFLKTWTIDLETNLDELRQKLKDTVFFIELALKRQLTEFDEATQKKLINSKLLLQDEEELKKAYFLKKKKLKEANQTPELLHVHTKNLAKPA
jgi:chromosome segregation ATPase